MRDQLTLLVAAPLCIGVGILAWAVARTWNSTLTAVGLAGLIVVAAIAAQNLPRIAGGQAAPPSVLNVGTQAGTAAQELEFYRLAAARFKHADTMAERGLLIAQQEPEGVGRWAVTGGAWPTTAGENGGIE